MLTFNSFNTLKDLLKNFDYKCEISIFTLPKTTNHMSLGKLL